MTTKLPGSQNVTLLGAAYSTPLGASVHADGTKALLEMPDPDRDPFPIPIPGDSQHVAFIPIDVRDTGRFFHFGGQVGSALWFTESYRLATDSWTEHALISDTQLEEHAGFVIGTKAYIFAGFVNWRAGVGSSGWEYDPATDNWTKKADEPVMPPEDPFDPADPLRGPNARQAPGAEAVTEHGSGRTGRTGFLFGGKRTVAGAIDFFPATHRYDAKLDMWIDVATSGVSRSNMGTSVLKGGIYTFGGLRKESTTSDRFINETWKFDPAASTWTQRTDLIPLPGDLEPFAGSRRSRIAATSLHGRAHLLGSDGTPSDLPQPRHDEYDGFADVFRVIAPTVIEPDFDDPNAPSHGWPRDWGRVFPNAVFWGAAACTVRGGIHLTGGEAPASSPWDSIAVKSRHSRWTKGAWVWTQLQTPIDIRETFFQRQMGSGWRRFITEAGEDTGLLEHVLFGPFGDRAIKDSEHVTLTL